VEIQLFTREQEQQEVQVDQVEQPQEELEPQEEQENNKWEVPKVANHHAVTHLNHLAPVVKIQLVLMELLVHHVLINNHQHVLEE